MNQNQLQIIQPAYNPSAPVYAGSGTPVMKEEVWVKLPKEFRTIGTQYEKQPVLKKKKSPQWKKTKLYRKALQKHWHKSDKGSLAKKKLRRIYKDIFRDKKIAWNHLMETGLAACIIDIKKKDGLKDEEILKWSKEVLTGWKKKFNKRQIIIK